MRLQGSPAWGVASGEQCQGQGHLERTGPGMRPAGGYRLTWATYTASPGKQEQKLSYSHEWGGGLFERLRAF